MRFSVDDQELNDELTKLLNNVRPSARKRVAKEIALRIRGNRAAQIKKNVDPDFKKFEPRKPQNRKKAPKGLMFKKLSGKFKRLIFTEYSASEALIGFRGKNVHVLKTHQEGGEGVVNKYGTKVRYPERRLLGIGKTERIIVRDAVTKELAKDTHLKG